MKLTENIEIRAPADQVWRLLAEPATWPRWNRKITEVNRSRQGLLVPGEHVRVRFQLKRSRSDDQIEVKIAEAPRQLVLRQYHDYKNRVRALEVSFLLEPVARGVCLTQEIDWRESGLPYFLRLLIWFIHKCGRPIGTTNLQGLKNLVESTSSTESPRINI